MTNRALLMAALAKGVSVLSGILISDDTHTLVQALHALGVSLELDIQARTCTVKGCEGRFPNSSAAIWCNNAGTVARFLLAACASSPGTYVFDGSSRMRERPIELLLKALCRQGASVTPNETREMPFTLQGRNGLKGGEIEIDGSESGQFISALLMAAPFAEKSVLIKTRNVVSRPFVEMTCAMMAEFGVLVRRMHPDRFSIPVPQCYQAREYVIEPDFSTASYFFGAAAVIGGQVTIQPTKISTSKQGDIKFLSILQKMGCQLEENEMGLTIKSSGELRGVSVDMRDCSDTFMTLAAIAPFAKSPTTITNIGHARLQESNRITVMCEELNKLNVKAEEGSDWIRIHPSEPKGGVVDPHQDHRIAMSFAIMGLKVAGVAIEGAECVSKTCPDFFEMWSNLY